MSHEQSSNYRAHYYCLPASEPAADDANAVCEYARRTMSACHRDRGKNNNAKMIRRKTKRPVDADAL